MFISYLFNQCKSELIESEKIRKDLADKFEIMLIETGACVLKRPTFERSITSFVLLVIINIKMCANAKGVDISKLNISSLFSFSLTPPFFSVNQSEVDKVRTLTGFDMDSNESVKQGKDAIIDFLESLAKLKKMLTEQKSLIESSFSHLRRKFTQINEIKKLDYEKNKIVYEQMMTSKSSFNFCFDILTDMDDPYFVTPEAGWHDVALAIQEEICRKYQLPKRKLLLSGESAGASLVSQMAAAYPDRVEAVATVGGSRFRHFPTGTKVKIFLLQTACVQL